MDTLRTFIALSPPREWRSYFASLQSNLKEKLEARLPLEGRHVFRWVATENIHLTLLFLGNTEEKNVPGIAQAIRQAATSTSVFSLSAGNVGCFPKRGTPRVLWLGLSDPLALSEFHSRLVRALAPERDVVCPQADAASFQTEDFTAHLTLARIKSADGRVARAVKEIIHPKTNPMVQAPPPWQVERVELLHSILTSRGPQYSLLGKASLNRLERNSQSDAFS